MTLTIPVATALGAYRLLACGDDTGLVAEASEGNNCLADAVRSAGDTLLSGARSIPILAPAAVSSGSVSLVVPSSTPAGTYVVMACADDTLLVGESSEANNCRASATALVVSP